MKSWNSVYNMFKNIVGLHVFTALFQVMKHIRNFRNSFVLLISLMTMNGFTFGVSYAQTHNTNDTIIAARLSAVESTIPLPFDAEIGTRIRNEIHSSSTLQALERYLSLQEFLLQETKKRNLPDGIAIIPLAVSQMQQLFSTQTGREGIWGLPAAAGIRFGLSISPYYDQRYDLHASTIAALDYIVFLKEQYGNWWKTLVAFSASPSVISILQPTDSVLFPQPWQLFRDETFIGRQFVSDFIFWSYVVEYYPEHNLRPSIPEETVCVEISLKKVVRLDQLLEKTGIQSADFKKMNPVILSDKLIPEAGYAIFLPPQAAALFAQWEDSLYVWAVLPPEEEKPVESQNIQNHTASGNKITYTVRSGDNLGLIAQKHGVSVTNIKTWNNLHSDLIHPGDKLIIYTGKAQPQVAQPKQQQTKTSVSNDGYITYTVKQGDSLWSIAQKFEGVTDKDIQKLNNISTTIYPGQVLKIKRK